MRFASGESHRGLLLVDLACFIQVSGGTADSPLDGLPDVGNLD